jgi:hypothetical protein
MAKVDLLRVVVVSPGDVQPERNCVESIADELNRGIGDLMKVRLDVVRWETDAFPGFSKAGSQGHIDTALQVEGADLVVGIFWKRFGTPVKDAASGTEHEIRGAYKSWEKTGSPQIMVYFNQAPPGNLTADESAQMEQVKQFQRDPIFKEGLYWNYSGPQEFEKLLRGHLTQYLRHRTTPAEMTVKTVDTPLGLMEVTQPGGSPSLTSEQVAPGLFHYRSPRFGFQIAWPADTWQGNDNIFSLLQLQMQFGTPPSVTFGLVVTYGQQVGGFTPNVNVIFEPVGGIKIGDYMNNAANLSRQMGQTVLSSEADEATQSGFRAIYTVYPNNQAVYQFQRVLLSGGFSLVATASDLPPIDQVGMRLRDELSTILNSFRL